MKLTSTDGIANALVLVGGLNWGLIGFFEYSLVDEVFGVGSGFTQVIYALVGLAAVYLAWGWISKTNKSA